MFTRRIWASGSESPCGNLNPVSNGVTGASFSQGFFRSLKRVESVWAVPTEPRERTRSRPRLLNLFSTCSGMHFCGRLPPCRANAAVAIRSHSVNRKHRALEKSFTSVYPTRKPKRLILTSNADSPLWGPAVRYPIGNVSHGRI